VPEDQLSLAIGRDGQNARLAAKLTAWKIDIKSLPEAAADALDKLFKDPDYVKIAASEETTIPMVEAILAKKSEGRPVTPEEYHVLTQFADRVEKGLIRQRESEFQVEQEEIQKARANVPARAFEIPLEEFEISDRVYAVISETGLQTVGDLILQMALNEDSIWKLSGMGPKAMQELKTAIEKVSEELRAEMETAIVEEELVVEAPELEISEAEAMAVGEEAVIVSVVPQPEIQETGLLAAELEEIQPAIEIESELEEPSAGLEITQEETVTPAPIEATEAIPEGEEELSSLDEIFALRPEVLEYPQTDEEGEGEEEEGADKKKKGKRKKKFVEVEYDPDKDVVLIKKKHKRGGAEWDENW